MIKIFKKRIDSFRGLPPGFVGKPVRMLPLYKGLRLGLRSGRDAGGEPSSGDFLETEGRKRKRRGNIKSEKKEPAQSFGGCAGFDVRNSAGEDTEDSIRPSAARVTEKNRLGDAAWMRKSKEGKVVLIRKRDGVAEGTHPCGLKTGLG